jgi:small redox-active disulfide protein 2
MNIKILGSGCAKCKKLYQLTQKAVEETGVTADIEKVEDMDAIISYGVMRTPALVIDEEIKIVGEIPPIEKIKQLISQ